MHIIKLNWPSLALIRPYLPRCRLGLGARHSFLGRATERPAGDIEIRELPSPVYQLMFPPRCTTLSGRQREGTECALPAYLPLAPGLSPESGFRSPRGIRQAIDYSSGYYVAKMDTDNTLWARETQTAVTLHLDNPKASTGSAANTGLVVTIFLPVPRGRNIPYNTPHCLIAGVIRLAAYLALYLSMVLVGGDVEMWAL